MCVDCGPTLLPVARRAQSLQQIRGDFGKFCVESSFSRTHSPIAFVICLSGVWFPMDL